MTEQIIHREVRNSSVIEVVLPSGCFLKDGGLI